MNIGGSTVIPDSWTTNRLVISTFREDEAASMKRLFEANANLFPVDPTFKAYPLNEYHELIGRNGGEVAGNPRSVFVLRKILNQEGRLVGYFQLEIHSPEENSAWIPMLVFHPNHQRQGYGQEVIASLVSLLRKSGELSQIRLNVYAANLPAFEFWVRNGFSNIVWWNREVVNDREYHCIVLSNSLNKKATQ